MAERDKLILGARAPSPAMSAKRETVSASRGLRLSVLRARAPALPVLSGLFRSDRLFGQRRTFGSFSNSWFVRFSGLVPVDSSGNAHHEKAANTKSSTRRRGV